MKGRLNAAATIVLGIALTLPCGGFAVEPREFATPKQRAEFKALIDELRCLVCQNQNLADSDAELAKDLRDEIHGMLDEGKDRSEIIDFMVERYGDFVLYRPPLNATTVALWFGPFVLIVGALWLLTRQIRKRRMLTPATPLDADERRRVNTLLEPNSSDP